MTSTSKPLPKNTKRIAWATGILCVLCCATPFVGIAVGSSALAATALYSEKAALVVAALGLALLAYKRVAGKKVPSCKLDCACRPAPEKNKQATQD